MSDYETTGSDIVKLVRKSARSTVHFAFSPGFDAKDSWLALNKRKTASHLYKFARREGPSKKVASGKMKLDGREVVLTCQTEIPALARKFKYFLHENGMSFKVRVLDKNGELIDTDLEKAIDEDDEGVVDADQVSAADDTEDDTDLDDTGGADAADPADDETAKLMQQYERLAPLIGRVQDGDDPAAAKAIDQLSSMFEKMAEDQDTDQAGKALKVLKRKLVGALQVADESGGSEGAAQAAS